eukprot:3119317-Amphidinium_carterae.1
MTSLNSCESNWPQGFSLEYIRSCFIGEAMTISPCDGGKYRCSSMESSEMMWVNVQDPQAATHGEGLAPEEPKIIS